MSSYIINISFTAILLILFKIAAKYFLPAKFNLSIWILLVFNIFKFKLTIPRIIIEKPLYLMNIENNDKFYILFNNSTNLNFKEFYLKIWVIGFFILIMYFIILYNISKGKLAKYNNKIGSKEIHLFNIYKSALKINKNIRLSCNDETSSCVIGFFKYTIYIPSNLSDTELKYTINHELMHIKYFDQLLVWFGIIILCINWYNPLIWVSFMFFKNDIEYVCDERVVNKIGSMKDYGTVLINLASKNSKVRHNYLFTSFSSKIERRLTYMINRKKLNKLNYVIIISAIIFISILCLVEVDGTNITNTTYLLEEQEQEKKETAEINVHTDNYELKQDIAIYIYENTLSKLHPYIKPERYNYVITIDSKFNENISATINVYTESENSFSILRDTSNINYIIKLTANYDDDKLIKDSVKCSFEQSVSPDINTDSFSFL